MTTSEDLPLVHMDSGLLRCPACNSFELRLAGTDGQLSCDDCSAICVRFADQCQECGARGVFTSEEVAFPAPGQSPKEAKSRIVRKCDACGFST